MAQPKPTAQPYRDILLRFLSNLDGVCRDDPGIACEEARTVVAAAILQRLIRGNSSHDIPRDFGMLTDEGEPCAHMNTRVRRLIEEFVREVEDNSQWRACQSDEDRQELVSSKEVRSPSGKSLEDFLGPWSEHRASAG